jgi:hypothetical protein
VKTDQGATINIADDFSDGLTIRRNVGQEVIVITVDKVRICLMTQQNYLSRSNDWVAPFGILMAILATLVSADFKKFYFDASIWHSLFIVTAFISLFFLVRSLIDKFRYRKHKGIEQIIGELTASSKGGAG